MSYIYKEWKGEEEEKQKQHQQWIWDWLDYYSYINKQK